MKKFYHSHSSGFTLVEVLISLALGAFVSIMTLMILTPGLRHVREMRESERLHANAVELVETVSYYVKQSKDFKDPVSSSKLEILFADGTIATVEKIGGNVTLDGQNIATSTTNLAFRQFEKSVQMSFTMKSMTSEFSATTTIARRNN
ncbi:MAG: type II secretion system protein [Candidatus Paceibacterota bacterium]|jgi:prepilin-type N-terminal cleavage/methylation domain-containing protein